MLSLACIGFAGSLTTFRRRRLASPTSILEIEATHPLVNPPSGRCVSGGPSERDDQCTGRPHGYVPRLRPHPRVVIVGGGFGGLQCAKALRDKPVDVAARRPPQLPPLHAAALPGGELPAEPVGDHRAAAQGVPRRAERPLPRRATSPTSTSTRKRVRLADGAELDLRLPRPRDGQRHQLLRQRERSREHALGLKDLGEALQLRNHVLECLERGNDRDRPTTNGAGC